MPARIWLAVLVCIAPLSPCAIADDKKPQDKPKQIDKATVEAWEKAGFSSGWMRTSGGTVWLNSTYPEGTESALPAFWSRSFGRTLTDENLKGLPVVAVPFALNASGRSSLTDAGLKHLLGQDNLVWLDLTYSKVTGEGLDHLAQLKSLATLKLNSTTVVDADLKRLAKVKSLTAIFVGGTKVGDEGLENLATRTNYTALYLGGTRITDEGLKHLAKFENLTELDLQGTSVTDAGLKHLAGLKKLSRLNLRNTSVTGEQLEALAEMKNLSHLELENKKITDQVLQQLQRMGLLHSLHQVEVYGGTQGHVVDGRRPAKTEDARSMNLIGTRVTPEGLKHLSRLTGLTNLYLDAAQVSPEGLKHLAALPKLIVLKLNTAEVRGETLKPLAGCKSLTHLTLPITDETLRALSEAGVFHLLKQAGGANGNRPKSADEIVSLDLSGSSIKGEGLKYAGKLKNLTSLDLRKTQVTSEWLEDFRRTLPKCKVTR